MGTGPFAVPSFEALRSSGEHEVLLVVTRPIENTGAKTKSVANPVRAWADEHGLPVTAPLSINESQAIDQVAQLQPDLLVVCDYGQILSANALRAAKLGGVNLHGSLLPRHRGAAPVQWSILRGDAITGACVIHMTPKLDGGPILGKFETTILPSETAGELERRLSELGVDCCVESVRKLAQFTSLDECIGLGALQDNALATPAPRLAKSDGLLDFRYPAALIERQFRGLQPWPGVFGNINIGDNKELRVIVGHLQLTANENGSSVKADQPAFVLQNLEKFTAGEILWGTALNDLFAIDLGANPVRKTRTPQMVVACSDGFVEITRIQPAGKKMQETRGFLAGYGRAESMRFEGFSGCPPHPLLEKMQNSARPVVPGP